MIGLSARPSPKSRSCMKCSVILAQKQGRCRCDGRREDHHIDAEEEKALARRNLENLGCPMAGPLRDSTLQVLSQSFVSQHRVATLGAWRGLQILKSQRASVL
ncbi:unnamed protein product [Symbiodinium necroappetens]|uniref:Uncharacterized protein n=1 Tax=Symbiodinium necroappetens TaxID=1628268 RepID=A0A812NW08_9DINO|nr:unnamed protein product [Symbiodinium necroappetens]